MAHVQGLKSSGQHSPLRSGRGTRMASAGALSGGSGQSPRWGDGTKTDEIFVFKTLIFNTSAGALHQIMCRLVCFLCSGSQVHEFTVRICSLAIADQHLSICTSESVVEAKNTYVYK